MSKLLTSRAVVKYRHNSICLIWFQRVGQGERPTHGERPTQGEKPNQSKGWLQRIRIDVDRQYLSVPCMKHIEPKDQTNFAPLLCQRCGGLMRLIGSEPHPVEAKTDLLTYSCTACEEFLVLPVSIPATGD
jgi:hypothetical protein